MSHEAFVSYASKDHDVAYRLVDFLESCGIGCWVAPRDVPGGSNYAEVILDALGEAKLFLLVFSEGSNQSEHVQREVERALHLSKPIVPVRIKDLMPTGAMDYYLATLHWIDGFGVEGEELTERGCEDVARTASAVLGREESIGEIIAENRRKRREEAARLKAEERELRIRLEAEAHAKAEAALEEARLLREEQQRERERQRELEIERERERRLEEERREREAERKREEKALAERRRAERAAEKRAAREERRAAAAAGGGGRSTRGLVIGTLLAALVLAAAAWWAKDHFASQSTVPTPPGSPQGLLGANSDPALVIALTAHFQWAGEDHKVSADKVLSIAAEVSGRVKGIEFEGDHHNVILADASAGDSAEEVEIELRIPGFNPMSRPVTLEEGEQSLDFGVLSRQQGAVTIRSEYTDLPRAEESHQAWLKMLVLSWEGPVLVAEEDQRDSSHAWINGLHHAARPEDVECSPMIEEATQETLDAGVYGAFLLTDCLPPFDRVRIATLTVAGDGDEPNLTVPIVPLGVFGGETAWTSTTTEAGQDEDGTVSWTLYNLPGELDFSEHGPRLVQSYADIVSDGKLLTKYYLPAPVTEFSFDPASGTWRLLADPAAIVRRLLDDDLTDRYFEAIEFRLRYHGDQRGIVFDAETEDQPLKATAGTPRAFPMQNAYPVFSEAVPALATRYPGFGVLNVNHVYAHLEAADKKNADGFRRSLTMPTAISSPLAVDLGVEVDRGFAGSGSVRLGAVVSGGPAAAAGLQSGDLLVSLAGAPIDGLEAFYRARFSLAPGVATEVKVLRNGEALTLVLTPQPAS